MALSPPSPHHPGPGRGAEPSESSACQTLSCPPGCLVEGCGMEPTSAGGQASGCSLAPACLPAHTQVLSTCPILQHQCLCQASQPPGKGLHGRLGGQTTLMPPPQPWGCLPPSGLCALRASAKGTLPPGSPPEPPPPPPQPPVHTLGCWTWRSGPAHPPLLHVGPLPAPWLPRHPL